VSHTVNVSLPVHTAHCPSLIPGAGHLFRYVTSQPPKEANSAFHPPKGSVNEYQLRLRRQRQVWFIPLSDECGVCRCAV